MSDINETLDELKSKKAKLEKIKTRLEVEKESNDEKIKELEPKILKAFGTIDVDELSKIKDDLEEKAQKLITQIEEIE